MSGLLSTVKAQTTAVETLRRALAARRVHHAYLFDGPDGVGKERAAFGLAQALVCERRNASSPDACGTCSACGRAVPRDGERRPVHPDVVVIERGLYDPAAIGRRSPETQDISIDQIRVLVLARAAFSPHEGRAKVFIVRRAEELSTAAANALLKTLEEPGPKTHFVLLSSVANSLMATIRSRTQRVRFGALPDAVVAELLTARGKEAAEAAAVSRLAGGSMQAALTLGDPDASARRDEFVSLASSALEANDLGAALALGEEVKKGDRESAAAAIAAFAASLGVQAREAVGSADRRAGVAATRHGFALEAIAQIEANASAQLVTEAMFIKMRGV